MKIRKLSFSSRVRSAVVGASLSLAAFAAAAAVDVSADVAAAKTDVSTAGGLVIGVIVAIAAIAWIRKVAH